MNVPTAKRVARTLLAACLMASFAAWPAAATYPTPDAAADALVAALKAHDDTAIGKVLGSDWRTYIPTEGVQREDVDAFVDDYAGNHRIVTDGSGTHLTVGRAGWQLPIPLAKDATGWHFDVAAGHDEIIARQIGHNEMDVVQVLLAYYDAQREYAASTHDKDSVPHYASKLRSTPGQHDGLYWAPEEGQPESPLGPRLAAEKVHGDTYFGYHYRILTAQGASAPGGAYDYVAGGVMANGFALIAWPARYGESGVMTFEISHDGQVFQKDLGKDTSTAITHIERFDPDSSWTEVPVSP
ncbi:DUF2950 domain-containing protein [Luteibacter aegosomaticola]|uniref:DUF2950 domain-containing protein n=1 Tax=Luteibacter aegosomaticola TaxID=2911538 RepID=UPI001FF8D213|nr:DUF2950 domain-containing protein [Luteibacter aegosomaticola]UPG91347.1 DUF2950 domain-containing protein [Luteibacter aegosomaticola]